MQQVTDLRILSSEVLPSPLELRQRVARTDAQTELVARVRREIHEIIQGRDPRLLVVVGPCSIHDSKACLEYARRLKTLADELSGRLLILMRVYFEKPRTTIGWKGLIMDPHMNNTCDIPAGLQLAREFLGDVLDVGMPTATEFLDPITPQYIADSISWAAIGARTVESQTHRQMASGLSMPVGFKNGTSGDLQVAVNAILAASKPQTFLGITPDGRAAAVTTSGNPDCQMVLRGGTDGPNFSREPVSKTSALLRKNKLNPSLMIDCSHANSDKNYELQPAVLDDVLGQIAAGNREVHAVMLESHLAAGLQSLTEDRSQLRYGVSITDGCIGWEATETCLRQAHHVLKSRN